MERGAAGRGEEGDELGAFLSTHKLGKYRAKLLCTSVLKSCMRTSRLDGDGGVSTLLLHFGAQTLHAQVSPGIRHDWLAVPSWRPVPCRRSQCVLFPPFPSHKV